MKIKPCVQNTPSFGFISFSGTFKDNCKFSFIALLRWPIVNGLSPSSWVVRRASSVVRLQFFHFEIPLENYRKKLFNILPYHSNGLNRWGKIWKKSSILFLHMYGKNASLWCPWNPPPKCEIHDHSVRDSDPKCKANMAV